MRMPQFNKGSTFSNKYLFDAGMYLNKMLNWLCKLTLRGITFYRFEVSDRWIILIVLNSTAALAITLPHYMLQFHRQSINQLTSFRILQSKEIEFRWMQNLITLQSPCNLLQICKKTNQINHRILCKSHEQAKQYLEFYKQCNGSHQIRVSLDDNIIKIELLNVGLISNLLFDHQLELLPIIKKLLVRLLEQKNKKLDYCCPNSYFGFNNGFFYYNLKLKEIMYYRTNRFQCRKYCDSDIKQIGIFLMVLKNSGDIQELIKKWKNIGYKSNSLQLQMQMMNKKQSIVDNYILSIVRKQILTIKVALHSLEIILENAKVFRKIKINSNENCASQIDIYGIKGSNINIYDQNIEIQDEKLIKTNQGREKQKQRKRIKGNIPNSNSHSFGRNNNFEIADLKNKRSTHKLDRQYNSQRSQSNSMMSLSYGKKTNSKSKRYNRWPNTCNQSQKQFLENNTQMKTSSSVWYRSLNEKTEKQNLYEKANNTLNSKQNSFNKGDLGKKKGQIKKDTTQSLSQINQQSIINSSNLQDQLLSLLQRKQRNRESKNVADEDQETLRYCNPSNGAEKRQQRDIDRSLVFCSQLFTLQIKGEKKFLKHQSTVFSVNQKVSPYINKQLLCQNTKKTGNEYCQAQSKINSKDFKIEKVIQEKQKKLKKQTHSQKNSIKKTESRDITVEKQLDRQKIVYDRNSKFIYQTIEQMSRQKSVRNHWIIALYVTYIFYFKQIYLKFTQRLQEVENRHKLNLISIFKCVDKIKSSAEFKKSENQKLTYLLDFGRALVNNDQAQVQSMQIKQSCMSELKRQFEINKQFLLKEKCGLINENKFKVFFLFTTRLAVSISVLPNLSCQSQAVIDFARYETIVSNSQNFFDIDLLAHIRNCEQFF